MGKGVQTVQWVMALRRAGFPIRRMYGTPAALNSVPDEIKAQTGWYIPRSSSCAPGFMRAANCLPPLDSENTESFDS